MPRRDKGAITPLDIGIIALVIFIGFGLLIVLNFLSARNIIISKQTIYLSMELDDRGSELVSLLGATSSGRTHMEILGDTFAKNHDTYIRQGLEDLQRTAERLESGFSLSMPGTTVLGTPSIQEVCIYDDPSGPVFLVWPMAQKTYINSEPGWRIDPVDKTCSCHAGIDISGDGIEVLAAADGTAHVQACTEACDTGYGNLVWISHTIAGDYVTRYGHLNEIRVQDGQQVKQGDVIGTSGNTGKSTGPHLHFELRKGGTPVNPCRYIQDPIAGCAISDRCKATEAIEVAESYSAQVPVPGAQVGNLKKSLELIKI
jgi:hypothetical protein